MTDNREARYAEAIDNLTFASKPTDAAWLDEVTDAVVAVADAEQVALKAEVERLRTSLGHAGVRETALRNAGNDWMARAESAEAALTSECEAHAGLRARLEALADRFSRFESPTMLTAAVVSRLRTLAAEPAEATASRPPETSGAGSIAPVAAEEGGEQEAGEVACGCKSEHNASSCPEYRRIMGLGRPNETAPRKTLAERLAEVEGTTPSVAAVRALMRAELAAPAPSGSDEPGNRPATPDANGVHDTRGG